MIIPKSAIRKFLERRLDDCNKYKLLTNDQLDDRMQRLPIQPPIWFKLKRHQQASFLLGVDKQYVYFANDTGCVAGNTQIETSKGPIRIDDLERQDSPIKVWSNTTNGLRIVNANCPFKRGPAKLFKIDFESGRSIIVTSRHRFLGKKGWILCGALLLGEDLPLFDVCLAASNSPYDTVSKITYLAEDYYYDLHVPIHENYIAHGLCHHNTGKSLLSIALIRYFNKLKTSKCALVLTPTKISKFEWAREIDKHSPKTKYCVLSGSSKHKWEQLTEDGYDLVIASYMGLVRMLCDLVPPKGRKKKDHLKLDKKKIDSILAIFDGLILDESTHCKTYGTLPFRICRQLSKTAKFVFALSGTPFGSDPTDLWAQMFLVDRGETLGPTLGLFRAAFFNAKKSYWGGFDYTFKKTMNNKLHVMLANRMIRYEAKQTDLPKLVKIVKEVRLSEGAWIYRDRAKETIEASHGSYRDMQNAFMRLRQISSGWLGYYDDDTNSKAQFQFTPNPKLELLISIIGSIDPKYKIIVFYEFNFSASLIEHELNKLKINFVRIWSGTKNHADALHRFDNENDCQILLLQNSAGFGPNLQVARYGIYFESPISPIVRTQTRRRFERQHSAHEVVFQYDLISTGTYDKRILFALKNGHDLFKAIIDGKQALQAPGTRDLL